MALLAVAVLVPARPATTVAGAIQPNGANQTALKNLLQQAETCGLNMAYNAMDEFGVDHCEDIKVSELPEGQSCEDFYSRQNLFTLCRGNLRWQSSSHCARGSNFTCWVPGVSNLKDAKAAGIRRLDESGSGESGSGETGSGDCEGEDCLEVGPWLVPPGKMPYPNGPDGQPAEYPEGVCPNGCNPGGTNPGEIPKDHLSVHKGDHSADGEWGFCWCPNPNDDVPAEVAEAIATPDQHHAPAVIAPEQSCDPMCCNGDVKSMTGYPWGAIATGPKEDRPKHDFLPVSNSGGDATVGQPCLTGARSACMVFYAWCNLDSPLLVGTGVGGDDDHAGDWEHQKCPFGTGKPLDLDGYTSCFVDQDVHNPQGSYATKEKCEGDPTSSYPSKNQRMLDSGKGINRDNPDVSFAPWETDGSVKWHIWCAAGPNCPCGLVESSAP